jgi:hypothetical protein
MPQLQIHESKEKDLKKIVLDYLIGKTLPGLREDLNQACEIDKRCIDLYSAIPLSDEDEFLQDLFSTLDITDNEKARLIRHSDNLYELLRCIAHSGNHHIKFLLTLIEKARAPTNWGLIFTLSTIFTSLLGVVLYFNKETINALVSVVTEAFPNAIAWLGRTFSLLKNLALLGIINGVAKLGWSAYKTFSTGINTNGDKLYLLIFNILTEGLKIAAYALTFVGGGILSFPAAILFVLSSSIELFKSLFILISDRSIYTNCPVPKDKDNFETWAKYERIKNLYARTSETSIIWITAATFSTITVGIWCFYPPNLIITITCISALTLASWARSAFVKTTNEKYAYQLQYTLHVLHRRKEPEFLGRIKKTHQKEVESFRQYKEYTKAHIELLKDDYENKLNQAQNELKALQADRACVERAGAQLGAYHRELTIRKESYLQVLTALDRGEANIPQATAILADITLPTPPQYMQSYMGHRDAASPRPALIMFHNSGGDPLADVENVWSDNRSISAVSDHPTVGHQSNVEPSPFLMMTAP